MEDRFYGNFDVKMRCMLTFKQLKWVKPEIFSHFSLSSPLANCRTLIYLYSPFYNMKLILLTILVSVAFLNAGASNYENNKIQDSITVKKLLSDIAKDNIFQTDVSSTQKTLQTRRGQLLSKQSPFDLLKICMENSNAVVRLYAFKALADKMDNLPPELVTKFRNDTTLVTFQTIHGNKQIPVSEVANGFLK